jgi:hypothetical protein
VTFKDTRHTTITDLAPLNVDIHKRAALIATLYNASERVGGREEPEAPADAEEEEEEEEEEEPDEIVDPEAIFQTILDAERNAKAARTERNQMLQGCDKYILVNVDKQICLAKVARQSGLGKGKTKRQRLEACDPYLQLKVGAPFAPGFSESIDRVLRKHAGRKDIMIVLGYVGDLIAEHACASLLLRRLVLKMKVPTLLGHVANPAEMRAVAQPPYPGASLNVARGGDRPPCNDRQLEILRACRYTVEAVQGPPGTGKSTMIAHMVMNMLGPRDRVLCTAVQVSWERGERKGGRFGKPWGKGGSA